MACPRFDEEYHEQSQVSSFLFGRGILFARLDRGPDPPDVIVYREGAVPLHMEVTEYHPEADRVGREKRSSQFRETLDGLIKTKPALMDIDIQLTFQDNEMPRRPQHVAIAEEVVRCVQRTFSQGWTGGMRCELSFLNCVQSGSADYAFPGSLSLQATEWPLLAEHVTELAISHFRYGGYVPSRCVQTQRALCDPRPDVFRDLLCGKEE